MKIGNGFKTYFWSDCWVGAVPLRDRFRRLFDLSVYKEKTVVEMCLLGWGEGGDAWGWWRRLLAWEEDLMKEIYLCFLILFCRKLLHIYMAVAS